MVQKWNKDILSLHFVAVWRRRTQWKIKGNTRSILSRIPKGTSHQWVYFCVVQWWPCAALFDPMVSEVVNKAFKFWWFLKNLNIQPPESVLNTIVYVGIILKGGFVIQDVFRMVFKDYVLGGACYICLVNHALLRHPVERYSTDP